MSFLKKLFGGSGTKSDTPETTAEIDYNGYHIAAQPYVADGQYQIAGIITKGSGEDVRTHRFIRADRCPAKNDATELTLAKARQIVDQQGDRMFS